MFKTKLVSLCDTIAIREDYQIVTVPTVYILENLIKFIYEALHGSTGHPVLTSGSNGVTSPIIYTIEFSSRNASCIKKRVYI